MSNVKKVSSKTHKSLRRTKSRFINNKMDKVGLIKRNCLPRKLTRRKAKNRVKK